MENDTPHKPTHNEVKATQALASMIATIQELRRLEAVTSLISLCETFEGVMGEVAEAVTSCEALTYSYDTIWKAVQTAKEIKEKFSKPLNGEYIYCGHYGAITDALTITRKLNELMASYEDFWEAVKCGKGSVSLSDLSSEMKMIQSFFSGRYKE